MTIFKFGKCVELVLESNDFVLKIMKLIFGLFTSAFLSCQVTRFLIY